MKKMLSALLVLVVLAGLSSAFAAGDLTVTYTTAGKLEDNYSTSDFMEPVADLQPGDSVTLTVKLANASADSINWYISNEVINALEESGASGSAYGYKLIYNGPGETRTLYDSDTVGGDDSAGLFEATEGLDELFYLDTMKSGETGTVQLTVTLDGETEGNEYFNSLARLQMNFAAEPQADTATETTTPGATPKPSTSTGKIVQTGDNVNLFPFYVAMVVSGLLFLALAVDSVRRRRNERKEYGE